MPILNTLTTYYPDDNVVRHDQLGEVQIPEEIQKWFYKLTNLEGVPLSYLIPHPQLLTPESIRFFYIDPNWVKAMAAGAFTLGQHSYSTAPYDDVAEKTTHPATGFLLRSALIKHFPGMKIKGYSDEDRTQELAVLREVNLMPDTLLMLFPGELKSIAIYSPPEGMELRIEDQKVLTDENGVLITKATDDASKRPEDKPTEEILQSETSKDFVKTYMDSGCYIVFNTL